MRHPAIPSLRRILPVIIRLSLLIQCLVTGLLSHAESGYELWLRYPQVTDKAILQSYRSAVGSLKVYGSSPTASLVQQELERGLKGMIGFRSQAAQAKGLLVAGAVQSIGNDIKTDLRSAVAGLGTEGYVILKRIVGGRRTIIITGNSDQSVLYGSFHFLRLMQTGQSLDGPDISSSPKIKLRMLNHWDNPNGTVERGYAGASIWNWHKLPGYMDERYTDYARANASIGINGTVLTNVNASIVFLTPAYLVKVKALADLFRPWGIKVYLTARFSSPIELGGLKTADPLDPEVKQWWKSKFAEVYRDIPDFGGFLIKANSEGQPGPQDYHRSHADGANMLAEAIAPFNGIIIWRAFVYSHANAEDRHKQAYNDFQPLDGQFRPNVLVQVKNGPIDFMPREPFHPLFGSMPATPLMMEFQVTQEYLGQSTNLVFLAPLFKETLESDTWSQGKGSTVARVVDGSLDHHAISGMAGVANIGADLNWTGHPFAQANWYALGRLAWDHNLGSKELAKEWLGMTFSNDPQFLARAVPLMLESRDVAVQYSNPIGLHHIMATGHHYGPAPWVSNLSRPEWNPVYYHKADSAGIGFDRTTSGSNALAQYKPEARQQWENPGTCDEKFLLWFHHLPWTYKMKSGRTLWEELCYQYYTGADRVRDMQQVWNSLKTYIDTQRFVSVSMLLEIQYKEALWWRDACLLYFGQYSRMPLPQQYEPPAHTLDYFKSLKFPYAPGN
ncbi:MAG: alpha-glucuronidase [Chitinophagaceae bacterium]|nr:MAG: alpha-glucuronidase [Chitinophagaceae bacterium]